MAREKKKSEFRLVLRGNAVVFIDWANVYNWKNELRREVDPKKLLACLQSYKQIKQTRLYFGTDHTHPASGEFIRKVKRMGYFVVTKDVKFLKVYNDEHTSFIWKRKCDFDLEIGLDSFELLDRFRSFIFFSGDGDLATLYERLINKEKQVIVVYVKNRLGREIWQMKKGIFKVELPRLGGF